jgi:hypothetical protein
MAVQVILTCHDGCGRRYEPSLADGACPFCSTEPQQPPPSLPRARESARKRRDWLAPHRIP